MSLVMSLLIGMGCCMMLYYGYENGLAEIVVFKTEADRRNTVRFLLVAGTMIIVLILSLSTPV
ncbi:MAG: hypothetical protein RLZZ387_3350 [Chloroflexota bacterium]|jgi:hypothetical protein